MEDVIQLLNSAKELKDWKIKAFGQLPLGEGITYSFYNSYDNGIVAKDNMTITVISYKLEKAVSALNSIKKLFITIGDDKLTNKVLHVEQNGGSTINNIVGGRNMYFVGAIFNVTRRA